MNQCKNLKVNTQRLDEIGDPKFRLVYLCKEKLKSRDNRMTVFKELDQLGYECGMLSDQCPFGNESRYINCPFKK